VRVLQVDSGREWRGGQNQVRLLCRELRQDPGIEQILATRLDGELARRAGAEGVTVHPTAWEIGFDPRAWWHLRRTIAAFKPDVIHAHDAHALNLAATVAGERYGDKPALRFKQGDDWAETSYAAASARPVRQVSRAPATASRARRGGSPMLAVLT